MNRTDVYLLTLHEPYTDPRHPVPINGLIVHAKTLLHAALPQPDGCNIYRCLMERPRKPDEIVPISTLTDELDGGRLWPLVGDPQAVTDGLVALARAGRCDSMPLGLPGPTTALFAAVRGTRCRAHDATRSAKNTLGPLELTTLAEHFDRRSFWPGDDLVTPPSDLGIPPG